MGKATVIIPARNEANSLQTVIPAIGLFSSSVSEVLIVVDSESDSSFEAADAFSSLTYPVSFLINATGGIAGAISTGVQASSNQICIICMADEILPLMSLDAITEKLNDDTDFVTVTRYSQGGKRYGGSILSHIFSKTANRVLRLMLRSKLTDLTTGMKGFHKKDWDLLGTKIEGAGWSPALAITLNAMGSNLNIAELPVISVDRLFGGTSSFSLSSWVRAYLSVAKSYASRKRNQ